MIPFQAIIGWPTEPAGAMGRIIAAVILFLVFIGGQKTPGFAYLLFWAMIIAEAAYAFYLVTRSKENTK